MDKLYHPLKDTVSDINRHFNWEKTITVDPNLSSGQEDSAENLAYILVQSINSRLPTITIVVKLVSCATGGPHDALLKNYTILSQHTKVH